MVLTETMYKEKLNIRHYNYTFMVWGLAMHLILLWGILDVNFHSPIIQELPRVKILRDAPAKRLVLFVADGLRFRTFIEAPPKYLKHIMANKGVWGVSHTRMPTESRPGNVAICAGLYEDPSAIFKGWKENFVDFDSIFNQSHFSWAWGSPDIIPMFTKGAKENVYGDSYPPEWQNFDIMQGQIWRLDSWVFDKYLTWLREEAYKAKNMKRIILFLHLLGCDTTGHTAKPYSREYTDNINYVDRKIEEVVQVTENFFGDNSTAYVFTSDHGMTDWGSHGSGSTDETETPLIVWGAGVNAFNSRQDVEQVDITPLISSLIGAPIPINNEGVLPWKYLNASNLPYMNQALLNNLKQLTHQVKANREMNCEDNRYADWRETELDNAISALDKDFTEDLSEKLKKTIDTIALAKDSLSYFRQYQRSQFLMYLSTMWLGWIAMLFFKIAAVKRPVISSFILLVVDIAFACLLIIIFIMHTVSGCNNWRLPCYASLAIVSFWLAVRSAIVYSIKLRIRNDRYFWAEIAGTILLLITMFVGLTYRSALSIGILSTALIQKTMTKNTQSLFFWTALPLIVFPLLPVVEPYPRIHIVLCSICVVTVIVTLKIESKYRRIMEICRLIVTGLIYLEFIDGRSWMSWTILLTTPLHICTYSLQLKERMQGVVLGLFCPLALLSASYEPFFFIVLALHLSCWPQFNGSSNQRFQGARNYLLTTEELFKAAIFMLYTLLCFFGTGNMASISSFDPSWTRHFVTVFSPFLMFSLILLKISIPLVLIGCASHILRSSNIFLAILLLGDCLSLPLVYYVTPQGSWLDIGSAISRFTIAITLPCLLLLLYYLSYPLMTVSLNKFKFHIVPEKKHVV